MNKIDLGVQVEKIQICAFYALLIFLFDLKKVAFHELAVVTRF